MSEVRIAIGRDHHIEAFTMWMAGGGVKAGLSYGETDDIGYSVVENGVHVSRPARGPSCIYSASITSS